MPPEPVRARAWGTRLRPTTSPTSVSETERERIHFSFLVCPPSHDDEKYDAVEGACQGGRSQDCRQRAAVEPIGTGRSPASEGWQRASGLHVPRSAASVQGVRAAVYAQSLY